MSDNQNEPQNAMEWVFIGLKRDQEVWDNANLFGRILFPIYIVMSACRIIMWWAMVIAVLPIALFCGIVIWATEHPRMIRLGDQISAFFRRLLCKPLR